jgi:lipoprotein-releasing system permease protein
MPGLSKCRWRLASRRVLTLPFELGLALRYLRPKKNFVSVITLFCVLGVALGVAVLIVVISVMSGFDLELRRKLIGFNSHLKVVTPGRPLGEWDRVMAAVEKQPGVKGVAPFIIGQVMMQTEPNPERRGPQSFAPLVRGIDVELEGRVSVLTNRVIEGDFNLRGAGVLVGSTLADQLGISVGDRVALHSTTAMERMLKSRKGKQPELVPAEDFEVRGIFQVGYDQIDASFIAVSLVNAQELFDQGEGVNGLSVMLEDSTPENTLRRQQQLREALGPEFRVISWLDENRDILGAIEVEKDAMLIILFVVMIVAAFCIVCSQIAFVIRKTREVGMLKAMGARTGQVVMVFLAQSSMVGVVGVVLGVGAGVMMVAIRNDFLRFMRWATGRQLFPQSIYSFAEIPALVLKEDLILICGVSLVICLLAGVVPAWIAASMRPVEALRNE